MSESVISIAVKIDITAEQLNAIDPKTVGALIDGIRVISSHLSIRPTLNTLSKSLKDESEIMTNLANALELLDKRVAAIEHPETVTG